jgi:hypothetical protein
MPAIVDSAFASELNAFVVVIESIGSPIAIIFLHAVREMITVVIISGK